MVCKLLHIATVASPNDITEQNCVMIATTVRILINSRSYNTHQIEALWFLFPVLQLRMSIEISYLCLCKWYDGVNFGNRYLEVK